MRQDTLTDAFSKRAAVEVAAARAKHQDQGAEVATATKTPAAAKIEPKEHRFMSRHAKLRLVRVPQAMVPDGWGGQEKRERFPGVTRRVYEFDKGELLITDGEDRWPDGPGDAMQDAVQWLQGHAEFNHRFFEYGNEPDRPLPTDEDFMDMVNEASVALDVDRIVDLLRTERETHNRPALVTVADRARRRTLETRQQLQDQTPPEAA